MSGAHMLEVGEPDPSAILFSTANTLKDSLSAGTGYRCCERIHPFLYDKSLFWFLFSFIIHLKSDLETLKE